MQLTLLNLGRGTRAKVQSSLLGRNFFVCLLEKLLETHGKQFLLGVVLVILLAHIALLHLVFQNSSTDATRPDTLQAKVINRLLFFVGNAISRRLKLLLIIGILETPLDVGRRRFLEVLLNMVEGVLRNIRDTKVVMDEKLAFTEIGRLAVTNNHLHEGGLARTAIMYVSKTAWKGEGR